VTSLVESLTIDCRDPRSVAEFWCAVLGYQLDGVDDEDAWISDPTGRGWQLLFQSVPEGKTVKNRLHLDLSPPSTMAEEVERLLGVGATAIRRVDEHGSFWTVMADPEGNEFCVLRGPGDDPPKERPV
jgi:catechol 2,3-dioxygenase-like lactoylglutathione lyase family enzyme